MSGPILYRQALEIVEAVGRARPLGTEKVSLERAMGRILSQDILSPEEVPSFDNSSMDGFAVDAQMTSNASDAHPVRIEVRGLIAAGDRAAYLSAEVHPPNLAVEIMTGAPVPSSRYNAIVKIEDVRVTRARDGQVSSIELRAPVPVGTHVRRKGTDFSVGQSVLPAGSRFGSEHVLACASLGITEVQVRRQPRVAILSTGSELVPPSQPTLLPGMIRNSTGPFLVSALQRLGVNADYLGIFTDDPLVYRKKIERVLSDGVDLILSTGAVSMGKFDFVSDVLSSMDARFHFHKAAIRPGKPVLLAEMGPATGGAVFFGIPGNPVSTAVGLRFFVEPLVRSMWGLDREKTVTARLTQAFEKPEGLRCFFKGRARVTPGGVLEVEPLQGQASYVVSSMMQANCWVVFPEAGSRVFQGDAVEIYAFQNSFEGGVVA